MPGLPSPNNDDNVISVFKDMSRRKAQLSSRVAANPSNPRLSGLTIGAFMGLAYGFISQSINSYYLPTVPFAHYPFGYLGNIVAATVAGALIGLACGWPRGGH